MKEYLEIALKAAKIAGLGIRQEIAATKVNKSDGKDIKLQSDLDSEKLVFKILQEESDLDILSEEAGFIKGKNNSELTWIVDPLDGSLNFSRGLPLFCISIALWQNDEPILGIIYDFNTEKVYTGIVGEGAWCNGQPIKVSDIKTKNEAIVCTGFPVYSSFEDESLKNFIKDIQQYKKVRLLGSAAFSLSMVAKGSADVYTENNIALWDIAAGLAIVKAAGGVINYHFTNKEKNLLYTKACSSEKLL